MFLIVSFQIGVLHVFSSHLHELKVVKVLYQHGLYQLPLYVRYMYVASAKVAFF